MYVFRKTYLYLLKNGNITFTYVFRPFTQYFVETPLAAITFFLGMTLQAWLHLYLGSFSHSSLKILSSLVMMDGERCCTAIFRSLQRSLIRFMSGLCLGHSRTFRDLSRSDSCVALAVWLGSLLSVVVMLEGEPWPQSEVRCSAIEREARVRCSR